MNQEIKVSVSCITFNHAPFIQKCLEGFLMQQVNFRFEILIHDDASTDGTQEIIVGFQQRYPDVIFPLLQKVNQYRNGVRGMNPKFNFPRSRGKYIALCEGDDYWTDPLKLQKQVDFLESNPDVVLCGHDSVIVNKNDEIIQPTALEESQKKDCSGSDLQRCFGILTQTMCFRNMPGIKAMPKEAFQISNGDKFLISFLGQFGNYKYLPEVKPSAYRLHDGGVWSATTLINRKKMMTNTYAKIRDYYSGVNNSQMVFFHGNKAFHYSKEALKLAFSSKTGVWEKVACVISFIKSNRALTSPILFFKIVFSRVNKFVYQ
jgi:glycosyltransferase involved in cell wall biosynthesis